MASHARMHSNHRHFHSHLPHHFKSIKEAEQQTVTLTERGTLVNVAPRATSSHVDSGSGGINPTIPIAVGICVPFVIIVVTFIWLHRRHVKKQRAEEMHDPHKSLDFGLGNKSGSSRGASSKEMAAVDFEKSLRRGHLSMDIGSPYLLPPELQNSRESLNSLSRNPIHEAHDPYRIVQLASAPNSARNSTVNDDNASTRTGSTMRGYGQEGMRSPLVPNAQRMPFSPSPTALQSIGEQPKPESRSPSRSPLSSQPIQENTPNMDNFVPPPPAAYMPQEPARRTSPQASPPPQQQLPPPPVQHIHSDPVPHITIGNASQYDDEYYDDSHYVQQPTPQYPLASPQSAQSEHFFTPTEESYDPHTVNHNPADALGVSNVPVENRRISVLRPLPPDDPADTPQQRAQRIRSFYKEYFNENDARVYQQTPNDYYEDYSSEYLGNGAVYDPDAGQFIVSAPYAEPIGRRAMTPPPRGPPRFQSGSRHNSAGSSPGMGYRARAFSTASAGQFRGRDPRARPKAPPPAALRTLPTPHLLKEDAFALPIDFAPPGKIRDQAAGRAPSPKMEPRPFSPQVSIASPLASSFNELPAMPSPHHLRRSGTFTALDFAPPPKFRDRSDASSDAGSIRSARSNHSTSSRLQVHNIRAGTYRVSRIPKELVGTHGEFRDILKPTWKVGS